MWKTADTAIPYFLVWIEFVCFRDILFSLYLSLAGWKRKAEEKSPETMWQSQRRQLDRLEWDCRATTRHNPHGLMIRLKGRTWKIERSESSIFWRSIPVKRFAFHQLTKEKKKENNSYWTCKVLRRGKENNPHKKLTFVIFGNSIKVTNYTGNGKRPFWKMGYK